MSASAPVLESLDNHVIRRVSFKDFRGVGNSVLTEERRPFLSEIEESSNAIENQHDELDLGHHPFLKKINPDSEAEYLTHSVSSRPYPYSPEAYPDLVDENCVDIDNVEPPYRQHHSHSVPQSSNTLLVDELLGENERLRLLVDELNTQLHEQARRQPICDTNHSSRSAPVPQTMNGRCFIQCSNQHCANWLDIPDTATVINCPICNSITRRQLHSDRKSSVFECILNALRW